MPTLSDDMSVRIINGEPMPLPYQLQMRHFGRHKCGAVLISPSFALTAEHCFWNKEEKDITIHAGGYTKKDKNTQIRRIDKFIQLENKDSSQAPGYPDIVILKVNKPFDINDNVKPACLPTRPVPYDTPCVVSGWGDTMTSDTEDIELQATTLQTITSQQCQKRYEKYPESITEEKLCAWNEGTSGCMGDSGGPLVCATTGGATLHGIVHGGHPNDSDPKFCLEEPNVYTDVFFFVDVIEKIIRDENDHPCPIKSTNFGDGYCDGMMNNAEHCFDGGDCCGPNANFDHCNWMCFVQRSTQCNCDCFSNM